MSVPVPGPGAPGAPTPTPTPTPTPATGQITLRRGRVNVVVLNPTTKMARVKIDKEYFNVSLDKLNTSSSMEDVAEHVVLLIDELLQGEARDAAVTSRPQQGIFDPTTTAKIVLTGTSPPPSGSSSSTAPRPVLVTDFNQIEITDTSNSTKAGSLTLEAHKVIAVFGGVSAPPAVGAGGPPSAAPAPAPAAPPPAPAATGGGTPAPPPVPLVAHPLAPAPPPSSAAAPPAAVAGASGTLRQTPPAAAPAPARPVAPGSLEQQLNDLQALINAEEAFVAAVAPAPAPALPPAVPAPAIPPAPTSLMQTSSATPVPQQGQAGAPPSLQSHSSGESAAPAPRDLSLGGLTDAGAQSEASPPAPPVPDRAAAPLPPPSSAAAHTHTQQVERVSARASLLVKPPAGGRTQAPEGGAAATAPQSLRSTEEESPAPPPSSAAAPAPTPAAGPAPAPGSGPVGITSASGLAPVSPPATGSQLRAETSAKQDLKKPTRRPPPRPVRQENSSGAGPLGAQQSATGDQAEEDLEITTQRFQSRLRGIAEANGFSVDKVTPPAVARLKIDPLREPQASSAPASPPGSPKPKDLKPSEVKRPTAPAPGQQQKTVAESIPTQPLTTALEPKSKEELAELAAEEALATLAKEIAEAVLAEEPLATTTSTSPRLGVGLAGTTSLAESLVQERSTRKGGLFNKNEFQENTSDEIAPPPKPQTTAQTRQIPRPITSPPNYRENVVAGTGKDPLRQVTAPSLLPSSDQEHLQPPGTLQPPSSATASPAAMGTAGLISAAQSPKPPSGADLPPSALARSAAEQLEPHDEESDSPDILKQIEYEIRTALQTIIPTISSEEIALHRTSLTSSSSTQGTTPDESNISLLLRIIKILQPDSKLLDNELLTTAIYAIEDGNLITYLESLPFANLQDPPTKPSNIHKLQAIKESLIELIPATEEDLEVLQGGHPGSHETSIQQLEAEAERAQQEIPADPEKARTDALLSAPWGGTITDEQAAAELASLQATSTGRSRKPLPPPSGEAKAELQSRAEIDRTQEPPPLVQPALSTSNAATAAPVHPLPPQRPLGPPKPLTGAKLPSLEANLSGTTAGIASQQAMAARREKLYNDISKGVAREVYELEFVNNNAQTVNDLDYLTADLRLALESLPQSPIPPTGLGSSLSVTSSPPPPENESATRGSLLSTESVARGGPELPAPSASAARPQATPAGSASSAPRAESPIPQFSRKELVKVIMILKQDIDLHALLREIKKIPDDITELTLLIPGLQSLTDSEKRKARENLQLLSVYRNTQVPLPDQTIIALWSQELQKINKVRLPTTEQELVYLIPLVYPQLQGVPSTDYNDQIREISVKAARYLRSKETRTLASYLHNLPNDVTKGLSPKDKYIALGSIRAMLIKRGLL